MTTFSPEAPQQPRPTELLEDIVPAPALEGTQIASEGEAPYQIVTLEDIQKAQESNYVADRKKSSAATDLMNLIYDTMEENGLEKQFIEIMGTPNEAAQEETDAVQAQQAQADVEPTSATETDEVNDSEETAQKGMRFGILRASAWLARGRDAALKHTVGRVAQATQSRQEATQQLTAEAEQTESSNRNEKLKKIALWAAVGAGAVAAAGVRIYIQNKGADFIGDHMPMHWGHGPKSGNIGMHIGEMVGQQGATPKASGTGNGLHGAIQEALNGNSHHFSINSGDTPWSVLTRNGVGGDQVYNRLTDAAQHLQADKGVPFEWHGTGTGMWIEVGGKSDTQSVMDVLSPYL